MTTKRKSTSVVPAKQLSLWDGMFDNRIRRDVIDGRVHFSVLDIFQYYGSKANPTQSWKAVLKFLQKQGFDQTTNIVDWQSAANNGGKATPFAALSTILRIAQVTEFKEWEPLRDWMAEVAQERIEERDNPELTVSRAVDRATAIYVKRGKDQAWIDDRIETISDYKLLCNAVDRVCDSPNYGAIVNTEYMALFGAMANELKRMLGSKSVRDGLPKLQLSYLHTAEIALRQLLDQTHRMKLDEIVYAARSICMPLGDHLREISQLLSIDPVTGQALLTEGN